MTLNIYVLHKLKGPYTRGYTYSNKESYSYKNITKDLNLHSKVAYIMLL